MSGIVTATDALAVLAAGTAAMAWQRTTADWHLLDRHLPDWHLPDWHLQALVVVLGALLATNFLQLAGAHRFAQFADLAASLVRTSFGLLMTLAAVVLAALLLDPVTAAEGPWITIWLAGSALLLSASRVALYRLMQRWRAADRIAERVAVVGAGAIGQRLLRHLNGSSADVAVLGVYDDDAASLPARCMGHPIRGGVDDLVRDIRGQGLDAVIVALSGSADHVLTETLRKLSVVPVDVRLCPCEFALRLGPLQTSHVGGLTLLNVIQHPLRDWGWVVKSVEDRALGLLILALISPLMLGIALLIRLDSPGPVLFRQKRYGFNNELIEVLKFRTMYQQMSDANAERLTQRNDPRITRIGAVLRRTSLDELPQFLNVLRGEMSIVGPRPHATAAKAGALLYPEAVKYYDARHRMKPGITGWAQVNGWRGETDTVEQIRKRVEHDLYYIENWSLAFDLRIILRTVLGGFTGRNAF
ncbi:MAG: undecaprenyl-phosphate glucose phosphotransferase [Alphaproteobacteria bacterium]|nr:undecaprenyl-phosphate glucose phosphotransferase [Alphaproteobacteria bacterium]